MEAEAETADDAGRANRWYAGCTAAFTVLCALGALAVWGLSELEKGLDGYGQIEETADGTSGGAADPLAPGVTAHYEDGLSVTVGVPHREPGGPAHRFTLTYENDTDATLTPGGDSAAASVSEYQAAPLVVRAGDPLDSGTPEGGSSSDWLNRDEAAQRLMRPLRAGERRTVPVRVVGSVEGMAVTVAVAPPDDGYRETAYWKVTLD
ncbi:hypothetical protein [Streptomyces sp. NPDC020742]|uniref:hypothetical protein n=1 Tax=unclassified Streptomyces TaxID=2593676 RepID=UPI0033EF1D16